MRESSGAAQVLHRASGLRRYAVRRSADYIAVQQAVTALLILGIADILLPLSGELRGLLLLWSAANVVLMRRNNAANDAANLAAVARYVESGLPELDNALIHSAQFAALLEENPNHAAAPLMQREMERADRETSGLPDAALVPSAPLRRERRRAQIALALALLSMPLFPRAWRFEIPRLLAFWRDNPSFTLTDFAVLPGSAQVPAGGGLTVMARLSGALPASLELVSAQTGAAAPQSAPMLKLDARTFSARMENISAPTWYYVRGETGRSSRFLLQIKPANNKKTNAPTNSAEKHNAAQSPDSPPDAQSDAQKDLRELANAQAKLAQDAKQNAGRNPKTGDPQTEALRKKQAELAQKAKALAQKMKSAPGNADAKSKLEQAQQAMNRAATGSVSKNATAAAEKLKQAAEAGVGGEAGQTAAKSAAGTRRADNKKPTDERANPRSHDRSGTPGQVPPPSAPLPVGKNGDASRYPSEYRKLVQDYFSDE